MDPLEMEATLLKNAFAVLEAEDDDAVGLACPHGVPRWDFCRVCDVEDSD